MSVGNIVLYVLIAAAVAGTAAGAVMSVMQILS
jgi:hypothetical protein